MKTILALVGARAFQLVQDRSIRFFGVLLLDQVTAVKVDDFTQGPCRAHTPLRFARSRVMAQDRANRLRRVLRRLRSIRLRTVSSLPRDDLIAARIRTIFAQPNPKAPERT